VIADLDADGDDELLICADAQPFTHVIGRELAGAAGDPFDLFQINFEQPGEIQLAALVDATGDRYPDVFVVWEAVDGGFWIDGYVNPLGQPQSDRFLRLGPFLRGCRPGAGNKIGIVKVLACMSAPPDSCARIIVFEYPFAEDGPPRRLMAFDAKNGDMLWQHETAAAIIQVCWHHRRDGTSSLLVSSHACNNGMQIAGSTDRASYVFCLSTSGKLLWRREYPEIHSATFVTIADLDQDGEDDVVVSRRRGQQGDNAPTSCLERLDPWTGERVGVTEFDLSLQQSGSVAGLAADARLIFAGADGRIHAFTRELAHTWSRGSDFGNIVAIASVDLDGDGAPDLAGTTASAILAFDPRGSLFANTALEGPIDDLAPVRIHGRSLLAVHTDDRVELYALRTTFGSSKLAAAGAGGLLVLAASVGGLAANRRRRGASSSSSALDPLVDAVQSFGHTGRAERTLNTLRLSLQDWERRPPAIGSLSTEIADSRDSFTAAVVPQLQLLVAAARRCGFDEQICDDLGRQAKQAASAHARLGEETTHRSPASIAAAAIAEILAGVRTIRRDVKRRCCVAPHEIVTRALTVLAEDLAGVDVHVASALPDEGAPLAYVSEPVLASVIENLVDNAIRAMANTAQRRLEVAISIEGDIVRIDVQDNGCGIDPVDCERIFDRSYTTKDHGGCGLYHCRNQLSRFDARIRVVADRERAGTTFRIEMHAVRPEPPHVVSRR